MTEHLTIKPIPPKVWTDGEIEMSLHGLTRYRTMTRAQLEREFPRAAPDSRDGPLSPNADAVPQAKL